MAPPSGDSSTADDRDVCSASYEQAQVSMRPKPGQPGTLLQAREQLLTCMRSGCKDWMVADCSRWLPEIEGRIPTVVFSARNTAGRDLIDVRVATADGKELTARLDGRPLEFEAGEQSFVFETPDGARIEKVVLVREGAKAQSVIAIFEAPADELAPRNGASSATRDRGPSTSTSTSTLQYVGYGLGGAGLIGLGLGTVFGISALVKKSDANCDANNECDEPALSDAHSAATSATVSFIVGGALLAGGISLALFAPPRVKMTAHAALRPGGGTLGLGGAW